MGKLKGPIQVANQSPEMPLRALGDLWQRAQMEPRSWCHPSSSICCRSFLILWNWGQQKPASELVQALPHLGVINIRPQAYTLMGQGGGPVQLLTSFQCKSQQENPSPSQVPVQSQTRASTCGHTGGGRDHFHLSLEMGKQGTELYPTW